MYIFLLSVSANVQAEQNTKNIKRVDSDDFDKSAQIPYWFKESFLEIDLDIDEALEEEKFF